MAKTCLLSQLDDIWKSVLFNPNLVILNSRKNTLTHSIANAFTSIGIKKTESQIFSLLKGKKFNDFAIIGSLLDVDIIIFNSNYTLTKFIQTNPKRRFLLLLDDTNRLIGHIGTDDYKVSFLFDNKNLPKDMDILIGSDVLVNKHIDSIIESLNNREKKDITLHEIIEQLYNQMHISDITDNILCSISNKILK